MTTAKLEAHIRLDAVQYQRAAERVQKEAAKMQAQTEAVQKETAGFGKTIAQAAAQMGLMYDANGNLVDGMGRLVSDTNEAAQAVRRFERQAAQAQVRMEKWQKRIEKIGKALKTDLTGGKTAFSHVAPALGGAAFSGLKNGITAAFAGGTAAAAGFFAYVVKEAGDAKEILQKSLRLNMDTTALQTWDYAVTKFGISADKAGDILKDVNDKVGDYIVTGGEAKDIFEALSLSAEEFIGLSPEETLIKMGDAMKGLSTQDKTFLLESLADDASLLIPLLDESGQKLKELKQQAIDRGLVISPQELKALNEFKDTAAEIGNRIQAFAQHFAASMARPLKILLDEADKLIDRFGGMDKAAANAAVTVTEWLSDTVRWAADVYGWFKKWEIKLIDLKAFLLSMQDGLAKIGELYLKYTPTGIAQNLAARVATGKSLTDGLAETRGNLQAALRELAQERADAEANIAKAHAAAEKFADSIGRRMTEAAKQAKADVEKNIHQNYRAPRTRENVQRSLDDYRKRQADAEAEKAAKEQERVAREQEKAAQEHQKAAEALQKAAAELERAQSENGSEKRAGKAAAEAEEETKPRMYYFTGAPARDEATERVKKATEAYEQALKKATEAQEKLNRLQNGAEEKTRGTKVIREEMPDVMGKVIAELKGGRGAAELNEAAAALLAQARAARDAGNEMSAAVTEKAALMAQQAALQAQQNGETAQAARQVADAVNTMAQHKAQAVQQPVVQAPPPPVVREVKFSGGITVNLNGSDGSVARAVVNSPDFKMGVERILNHWLRNTAQAVN